MLKTILVTQKYHQSFFIIGLGVGVKAIWTLFKLCQICQDRFLSRIILRCVNNVITHPASFYNLWFIYSRRWLFWNIHPICPWLYFHGLVYWQFLLLATISHQPGGRCVNMSFVQRQRHIDPPGQMRLNWSVFLSKLHPYEQTDTCDIFTQYYRSRNTQHKHLHICRVHSIVQFSVQCNA